MIKIFLILLSSHSFASDVEVLLQKITSLRAEVETNSRELETLQKEKQAELDLKNQKKLELSAQYEREKMRSLQINEKLKRLQSKVHVLSKNNPNSEKKILIWISDVEAWVASGIPYEKSSRLSQLNNIKNRLTKKHEAYEFIAADLWSFLETEIKLVQTNEYKILDLEIAGTPKKCEVARIGLKSLYAIAPDKKIYFSNRSLSGDWKWEDINTNSQKESVISLIKNLKLKNDSGFYQLPVDKNLMGASL